MRLVPLLAVSLMVSLPAWADDGFDADAHLLGDLGGMRPKWEAAGVTVNLQETSELFAVPSGGLRQGAVYDGQTQASVKLDTGKLGLWDGGTVFVSAWNIHGRGPTRNLVGGLMPVSSVEATDATRLDDLYYEHTALDGAVALRIGQFAADEEFITTQYGAKFVNSSFGFPALPSNDLPSGGPAYPLSTPALRIKVRPTDRMTVLAAVFNGNPSGPTNGDPQVADPSGTSFRLRDGVFGLVEAQYTTDPTDGDPAPLATTYRVGAWFHSQRFSDQHIDTRGLSLANPASSGIARQHRDDTSLYVSIDQRLWSDPRAQEADPKDNGLNRGIGGFLRVMGGPSDRNLIDFAASAGLVWFGPFDARPSDLAGFGVNYAHVSKAAQAYDADLVRYGAAGMPIRDSETVFELTYAAQLGWLAVQPSLQYVIHPSGGVLNPVKPGQRLKDAAVAGLRAVITF